MATTYHISHTTDTAKTCTEVKKAFEAAVAETTDAATKAADAAAGVVDQAATGTTDAAGTVTDAVSQTTETAAAAGADAQAKIDQTVTDTAKAVEDITAHEEHGDVQTTSPAGKVALSSALVLGAAAVASALALLA